MNREELIKKWLDNNLNLEEQIAFEQLEDYEELIKMDDALKHFKSTKFSVDANYHNLKTRLTSETKNSWWKPLLRIAAVLAIGFSIYYYTTTLNTEVRTQIAEQTEIALPDASQVRLNANSYLAFNNKSWSDNREVHLKGEAYFKVAKGQKFDVITSDGTVSVLGTEFNVKQRQSFYEVTCYEGLVAVSYDNNTARLKPGQTLKIIDGKLIANEKEIAAEPSWLSGESNFKAIPLKYVIIELENQYNIKVNTGEVDTSRSFTGSFTHNNLELALKSITLPLNLDYSKSGESIRLKRE